MLKADKLRAQKLASDDEATRLAAAEEFQRLEQGHFENHPVMYLYIKQLKPALLKAHRDTSSALVRQWVTQMLAEGGAEGEEVDELMAAALLPDCTYLPTLLYYISTKHWRFQAQKAQVKALYQHPDEEVRWRVAYVLEKFPLTHAEDADCLRALATDSYYMTRMYAVLGYSKFGTRTPEDLAAMRKVVEMGDDAARVYAQGVLYAASDR